MLKLRYLFENYDLAKAILSNWEYDNENLDEMLIHFRISSNAVYPFSRNGKPYYLRFAPVEEKRENNVFGEMEFIQYLLKDDYPALEPIKSIDGEYIKIVNTEWGNYYASVFKGVPGIDIEDVEFSEEVFYSYGKALGKLHKLSSEYKPNIKKWTYDDVLLWMEEQLTKHPETKKLLKELKSISMELYHLPKDEKNYGLVHFDFELDNVFYSKEENKCYVIDFEDGMYHWFAVDIEKSLEAIDDEVEERYIMKAKEKFIEGYKSEYYYDEDVKMMELMKRFIKLYSYCISKYVSEDKFEDEPEWLIYVREKLEGKMLDYEAYIKEKL